MKWPIIGGILRNKDLHLFFLKNHHGTNVAKLESGKLVRWLVPLSR